MKTLIRFYCILCLCIYYDCLLAQLPASNAYLLDFEISGDTFNVLRAKYLTAFNPEGYNNQISFLNKNTFLLSSNFYNPDQTDIIKLNLGHRTMRRITKTEESEYSPIFNDILKRMSVVKALDNGDQKLWLYKLKNFDEGEGLLVDHVNVGYYLWDRNENLYLFLLGGDSGNLLAYSDPKSNQVIPIIENIGRCFKIGQEGELYFVHKVTEDVWYIKSFNPDTRKLTQHIRALKGKEDFEMIENVIISGSGALIYKYHMGVDTEWSKYIDLSAMGIKNITRLNLKENRLLLIDKSKK